MIKKKKILHKVFFAVLAIVCTIIVPCSVQGADKIEGHLRDAGITKVYTSICEKGGMRITGGSATKEILVGVAQINKKKGTITIPAWESYDYTGGEILYDLSHLNSAKDNYIALSAPEKGISIIKFSASPKYMRAKFDAVEGVIKIGSGDKASDAAPNEVIWEDSKYQYTNQYCSWEYWHPALMDETLYSWREQGATIYLRLASDEILINDTEQPNGKEIYTYGSTKVQVYDGASLQSKAVKVHIPARAKGPKVTADYAKGTIKFPKNSEYRMAADGKLQAAGSNGKYTPGPTVATPIADIVKADAAQFQDVDTFDLEVRTVATAKKAASKWSRISVTQPEALDNALLVTSGSKVLDAQKQNGQLPAQGDVEKSGGGNGIKAAEVKESTQIGSGSVLDIAYIVKGRLDASKYYTANAVEIKNNGEKAYEVVVGNTVSDGAKTVKIGPKKKVTLTKLADGSMVWIRIAGDKKQKVWVGKFAELGVIDYPFEVPKKER